MKRRRTRERRRRWIRRASDRRWKAALRREGVERPEYIFEARGVRVTARGETLLLEATDYHAGPVHLAKPDLESLGLRLAKHDAEKRPSIALAWLQTIDKQPDKASGGPALGRKEWKFPQGLAKGGFHLARVRDGVDVFVTDFAAGAVRMGPEEVLSLGIRSRPRRRSTSS